MKIKKFSEINEGFFDMMWDDANKKAVKSYTDANKKFIYTIHIKEPCDIELRSDEIFNKLNFELMRQKINYDYTKKGI